MDMDKQTLQLSPPAQRFGVRHVQTAIMALTSFGIYTGRISLSVAIVAMTGMGMEATNMTVSGLNGTGNSIESPYPVYDWDEQTQGLVLSSFFWGYVLTQLPAGVLTQKLGGNKFLIGAMFTTSLVCILLPYSAYLGGWRLVCANRMLQGMAQGFVYPSIFTMMGLWTPTQERSRLSGVILGAQTMGPVIATPIAGWLAATCGWPSIFYCVGALGLGISVLVFKFGADSPAAHRTISAEERAYIQMSSGGSSATSKIPIPWRDILCSSPAWAVIMTMALQGGVFLAFLTKIPTYLSSVLKFDIKDNGVLTAVPYFTSWLLSYVFSWSCDWLIGGNYLSLANARKLFNSISHVGSGIAMILLGYCTNTALSVVLLAFCIGVMSASYPGAQSNFMDLSPNMAGTIFSISNFLSAMCGVAGPIIVGAIVTEPGSVTQWRTVYFVFSAVVLLSNLHFVVCGRAEVQPWNFPKGEKKSEHKPENDNFIEDGIKLTPGGS